MDRTAFKVVTCYKGKLMSVVRTNPLAVEYEPEKCTQPKKGYLFCFGLLEDAVEFCDEPNDQIWQCEIVSAPFPPYILAYPGTDVPTFWEGRFVSNIIPTPPEFIFAVKVKLTERIK